jgi:hypothetical protein
MSFKKYVWCCLKQKRILCRLPGRLRMCVWSCSEEDDRLLGICEYKKILNNEYCKWELLWTYTCVP